MESDVPNTPPKSTAARQRRRLLVLLLSPLAVPIVAELVLRWMLFSPDPLARAVGADMRRAGLYAASDIDEEYWLLRARFDPETSEHILERCHPDPVVGWRNPFLLDDDYNHLHEPQIGPRRPVLVYGASFVLPPIREPFQALPEGALNSLISYGTGGFGVGQSLLMARQTLSRHAESKPLVLLAVCLSADLPRAAMGLREGAKPAFALDENGKLTATPFEPGTFVELAQRRPVGIDSYLWAFLSGRNSPIRALRRRAIERANERRTDNIRLNQVLIRTFHREVTEAGLECVVLLMNDPASLAAEPRGREREIVRFLEERDIGYLDFRRIVRAALKPGVPVDVVYNPPGSPGAKHPNDFGNLLIAGLVICALEGHRDHSSDTENPYRDFIAERVAGLEAATK